MSTQSHANFVEGLFVEYPHEKAPDYVLCKASINVDKFIKSLEKYRNYAGYVNLDIKKSKKDPGKLYSEVNTWTPDNI